MNRVDDFQCVGSDLHRATVWEARDGVTQHVEESAEFGDSSAMRPGAACGGESRLDCGAGRLAGPVLLQNAHPLPFQNSDRATDGEEEGGHAAASCLAGAGKSPSVSFNPAFLAMAISGGLRHSGMKFLSLHPMIVVSGMRLSRASFAGPPSSLMMSDAVCM